MSSVNNIQRFREERGWSRPELARRMGTTPQQIERLEKGQRSLRQEWIDKAAEAFGVAAPAIITTNYDTLIDVAATASPQAPPPTVPNQREHSISLKQIDLGFSMGAGANIDDYVEEGTLEFDTHLLATITRSPAERLFVARGDGDSMMPTLIHEDTIVVDTLQRQLTLQDRIWACSIHGAGAIKRLRAIGKQKVLVISDNPTVDNQEVDAEDLFILGRVIWVGRRV